MAGDALTADQRRDIHALTRQHERGALTDAEFAAELARISAVDQAGSHIRRDRRVIGGGDHT
ncbi:hypothetical protein [Micromonospora sp. NPDC005299]|uniref:hypothetical protein n=1 Tax=Micromonospora sp. NPDC005299 TaxID=3364231 RepID=UPI0036934F4A